MFGRKEKTVEELRKELIDDCYAAAFGGGIGPALLETPDIERMSEEVRLVYPNAKIVTRHIKKNPNQEHHKGLTYDFMEDYIRNYAPEKTRKADLDEFHQKLIISECHSKAFRYPTIKKWFLDKYPEVTSFVLTAAANQQPPAVQAPAALDQAA